MNFIDAVTAAYVFGYGNVTGHKTWDLRYFPKKQFSWLFWRNIPKYIIVDLYVCFVTR